MERRLTKKQETFIERYIETGDATQAAIEAGYSERTACEAGSRAKKDLANEIDKRMRGRFKHLSPKAAKIIADLADKSDNAMVQYRAASDILDRGGYKPVDQVEDVTTQDKGLNIMQVLRRDLITVLPQFWPLLPPDLKEQCLMAMGIDPKSVKPVSGEVVELRIVK